MLDKLKICWCRIFHDRITRPRLNHDGATYHCLTCGRKVEVKW